MARDLSKPLPELAFARQSRLFLCKKGRRLGLRSWPAATTGYLVFFKRLFSRFVITRWIAAHGISPQVAHLATCWICVLKSQSVGFAMLRMRKSPTFSFDVYDLVALGKDASKV